MFAWIAFFRKPCDIQAAMNVSLTHGGLEYCAHWTVSVQTTENAPVGSERDLRMGTHPSVPEETGWGGMCPPGVAARGVGRALAGVRVEARKFLMSSTISIILSAAEEGLAVWRDSQRGTKDRGEGFFQEPEFIHKGTRPSFYFHCSLSTKFLRTGP